MFWGTKDWKVNTKSINPVYIVYIAGALLLTLDPVAHPDQQSFPSLDDSQATPQTHGTTKVLKHRKLSVNVGVVYLSSMLTIFMGCFAKSTYFRLDRPFIMYLFQFDYNFTAYLNEDFFAYAKQCLYCTKNFPYLPKGYLKMPLTEIRLKPRDLDCPSHILQMCQVSQFL